MKKPVSTAASALLLATSVLVLDQLAKHWATASLSGQPQPNPSALGGWISLLYIANRGAAFGVLAGSSGLFVGVAVLVVIIILASLLWFPARRPTTLLSLALQLGGAAGNLVDRVRLGFVVDFIYVRPLPVFNLADAAILGGACLLGWIWLSPSARATHSLERDESRL